MIDIGLRIKTLRKAHNFTQAEFAKASNISRTYLSDIENNRYNPSIDTLDNIIETLGVTVNEFFQDDNLKLEVPQEYTDKYTVTTKDKEQYIEHMKKATESFFMNDEFDDEDKKEILDTMTEIFWKSKAINKDKRKKTTK